MFSSCLHLYVLSYSFLTTELCDSKIHSPTLVGHASDSRFFIASIMQLICSAMPSTSASVNEQIQCCTPWVGAKNCCGAIGINIHGLIKKCMTSVASIKTLEGNPPFETYWNWNHVLHQPVQSFVWLLIHFKRSLHNDLPTSLHGTWLHQKGWLSLSHIWQVSCLCLGTQTTDLKIERWAELAITLITHLHPKSTQSGHAKPLSFTNSLTARKVFTSACSDRMPSLPLFVFQKIVGTWAWSRWDGPVCHWHLGACHSGSMLIVYQPNSADQFPEIAPALVETFPIQKTF